ncbi:DUF6472 family protein [Ruminococcus sp.]|uniref:DUF6472 family protein n=1 Tax=Ruminococcus sp. TaxID=41978 RepID=UPI0025DA7B3E|nr:DUF6472 family protein [Ruminococcus sp.]
MKKQNKSAARCESCVNYVFDEDYECYSCLVNLDEDEVYRFLNDANYACPYYRLDDEYAVVRKQN